MSAIIGLFNFDEWKGDAPPAVKSTVELLYKPGQSTAAARILPNQSSSGQCELMALCAWADAHTLADSYRSLIGTITTLVYHGTSYGNILIKDVSVVNVEQLLFAQGVHPDGTSYAHSPAGRVTSRWDIVRLS